MDCRTAPTSIVVKMEFHFEETFERLKDILRGLILEKSLEMLLDNKGFGPTMSRR